MAVPPSGESWYLVAAAAATAAGAASAACGVGGLGGSAIATAVGCREDGKLDAGFLAGALGAGDFLLLIDDNFLEAGVALVAEVLVDGHGGVPLLNSGFNGIIAGVCEPCACCRWADSSGYPLPPVFRKCSFLKEVKVVCVDTFCKCLFERNLYCTNSTMPCAAKERTKANWQAPESKNASRDADGAGSRRDIAQHKLYARVS